MEDLPSLYMVFKVTIPAISGSEYRKTQKKFLCVKSTIDAYYTLSYSITSEFVMWRNSKGEIRSILEKETMDYVEQLTISYLCSIF